MPYKDKAKRREAQRRYAQKFKQTHGVCLNTVWLRKNPDKAEIKRAKARHRISLDRTAFAKQSRERLQQRRQEALTAYGGQCKCCGEMERQFLTFDHMNNDGAEHRRRIKSMWTFYRWLIVEHPESIQVLCFNCNCSKGFYGVCPHERNRCLSDAA